MPETTGGMPLPTLFHEVSEVSYGLATETLDKLRAANTHNGRIVYRDDELLLFALCQFLETSVDSTPPTVCVTSTFEVPEEVDADQLSDAITKVVLLDRERPAHKAFFEEHRKAVAAVVDLVGKGYHFQDDQGVVYTFVEPEGTYVAFDKVKVERTRRPDEKKGSLSMVAARNLGYEVEGR